MERWVGGAVLAWAVLPRGVTEPLPGQLAAFLTHSLDATKGIDAEPPYLPKRTLRNAK